jgi:hypothetical protein
MKKGNVGTIDRAVRMVAGLALLLFAFVTSQAWYGVFGMVLLLTGMAGYCPLYELLGVRTCSTKS